MTLVIETKVIKPQRLSVQEVRLELLNALRKEGTAILREYRKTIATWRHKPKFEKLVSLSGGEATVVVGTDDEVYGYVDLGTRPHRIVARNAPYLVFRSGRYSPKTRPGVIGSTGSSRGGPFRRTKAVNHPGNKPRKFSLTIQQRRKKPFHRAMVAAMKRGARKANARRQA